ncbi:PQQ-binding-like beta-propeller repeat protein [Arthrobacter sp. H14-L1]|uniref:PQQ-binding-like beta-propeller repeat protein n=1 Tax=Arthrobacter sp. H14-L1 TaxID=2996697 RepID=UPI003B64080C
MHSSPTVDGGLVCIGCRDHRVYAVDAATGEKRWAYTTESTVDFSAVISSSLVYFKQR